MKPSKKEGGKWIPVFDRLIELPSVPSSVDKQTSEREREFHQTEREEESN